MGGGQRHGRRGVPRICACAFPRDLPRHQRAGFLPGDRRRRVHRGKPCPEDRGHPGPELASGLWHRRAAGPAHDLDTGETQGARELAEGARGRQEGSLQAGRQTGRSVRPGTAPPHPRGRGSRGHRPGHVLGRQDLRSFADARGGRTGGPPGGRSQHARGREGGP